MKHVVILVIAVFFSVVSEAKNSGFEWKGYSGGMMLHSGYVKGPEFRINTPSGTRTASVEGLPLGIGGAVKLHFGKNLRLGMEGYSSTVYYGRHGSYFSAGWGGVLADYVFSVGDWSPFAGITIGGGGVKNVYIGEEYGNDFSTEDHMLYRKYPFMALSPFVGVEYKVTKALRIVLKADYLFNISRRQADYATGLRLYVGIVFYKIRN